MSNISDKDLYDELVQITEDIKLNKKNYTDKQLSELVERGIQNLIRNDKSFSAELKRRKLTYETLDTEDTTGSPHYNLILRAIERIRFFGYIWLSGSTENKQASFVIFCPRHGVTEMNANLDKIAGGLGTKRNEGGMKCCSTQRQSTRKLYQMKCNALAGIPKSEWSQADSTEFEMLEEAYTLYENLEGKFQDPSTVCNAIKKVEPGTVEKVEDSVPDTTRADSVAFWGKACVISGKTKNVELHHMYIVAYWPCLEFVGMNCIPIHQRFHEMIHDIFYDYQDSIHLPVTGSDFILFLQTLIGFWKVQLEQMERNERPRGSEAYLRSMIQNCETLIPKVEEANLKLKELIKTDMDQRRSDLLEYNVRRRKDSSLENFDNS